MQALCSKKYYRQLFCFSLLIVIMQKSLSQNCVAVIDSSNLVEIEGIMENGRPYLDFFIIKQDDYKQVLSKIDSFHNISSLLNSFVENGTLTFDVSERTFYETKNCYVFNSDSEKYQFIKTKIDRFNKFEKKLKEDKRLFFEDGSQAFFSSKQAYFHLWKLPAKENMLTYSSAMYFSDKLKYTKSYYFEIESINFP